MTKQTKQQVKKNILPTKKQVLAEIRKDWGEDISKLYEEYLQFKNTRREIEDD